MAKLNEYVSVVELWVEFPDSTTTEALYNNYKSALACADHTTYTEDYTVATAAEAAYLAAVNLDLLHQKLQELTNG